MDKNPDNGHPGNCQCDDCKYTRKSDAYMAREIERHEKNRDQIVTNMTGEKQDRDPAMEHRTIPHECKDEKLMQIAYDLHLNMEHQPASFPSIIYNVILVYMTKHEEVSFNTLLDEMNAALFSRDTTREILSRLYTEGLLEKKEKIKITSKGKEHARLLFSLYADALHIFSNDD